MNEISNRRIAPRIDSQGVNLRWWHGWLPLAVLPCAVLVLASELRPRWVFMWSLAFAIYCGCKWLTWRRSMVPGVAVWRHAGYLLAWPGLDARAFLTRHASVEPPLREWCFAWCKFALGVLLIFVVARRLTAADPYWVGWAGMVGLVMVLHFGIFHLLSCAWRRVGVDARPLMHWPLLSVSLSEFWGRRWNTAFRDLTHRFLFRPFMPYLGGRGAVIVGFAFSGLVHDAVISLPAGGGYGRPTLFFLLQGAGVLAERSRAGRSWGLGAGARGWLFAMSMLLLPLGLLFHRPFVLQIILPFMHSVGAL